MAYDPSTGQLVFFGGDGGNCDNDTWTWNGTTWTQLNPATSPPARSGASMAYDPGTGQLVLFGGIDACNGSYLTDTWTWNGTTWTQSNPATSPPARSEASMAYDRGTGQLLLFGGQDLHFAFPFLDDTWTWNGTTWTELNPATSPPARSEASMAYDPGTGQLVLFGGYDDNPFLNDTWTWTGTIWIQLNPVTSPPVRAGASMAYDPGTGQLVLFGGTDAANNAMLNDTWTWNGTTWAQQAPIASPPGRSFASMAYDPGTGQLVFTGAAYDNGNYLNDTWTWNELPTTSVLIPWNGAKLSGFTLLDATARIASSVEFRLFGGIYGYDGPVVCKAVPSIFGWVCVWNTRTVPDGSYVMLSEASNTAGSAFSSGVSITVKN
jgi:hypothetical protein